MLRQITTTLFLVLSLSTVTMAGTVSPIQSSATPFGLDPIADVQLAGSDADAADFQANELPILQNTVNETLTERSAVLDVSSIAINPDDLYISSASNVRVYFIGEGAGYHNSFGLYTGDSSDGLSGDAALIFPDASTHHSYYYSNTNANARTPAYPVLPGDFVDVGLLPEGTQMNLFLIANGAYGGSNTYFTDDGLNADGIEHFIVLATPDSPYLLVGVEDLYGGGDQDYNDAVVALDVGTVNASLMISRAVPLPGYTAVLMGPFLLLVFRRFKERNSLDQVAQTC